MEELINLLIEFEKNRIKNGNFNFEDLSILEFILKCKKKLDSASI